MGGKIDLSTVDKAFSALGRMLSMRNQGGSRYTIIRTDKGNTVAVRLADHGANGKNFYRDEADSNLSIVIERRRFETPESDIEFTEVVIPGEKFHENPEKVFRAIVDGVDAVIQGGEFTLPEDIGKVIKYGSGDGVRELRDSHGVVYGWVKNGEIYLNKDRMNPETPLHEYTHTWDEMVKRENPILWTRGKELMKQLPLWDEVVNDPAYSDLHGDEDAIASEVHARLTGERGARVLEQMVEDAKAEGPIATAEAVTLVSKVKGWLRDMFNGLKKTLGKWTKRDLRNLTAEQFADMTLRDLAQGINPRHGDKELVTLHNISESKLRKALKLGKLVNPSMAVVKAGMNEHNGYGSITLVARGAMSDKKAGRNAGTYPGDAWTPSYPQVERSQSLVDKAAVVSQIAEDVPKEMRPLVTDGWNRHIDGNSDAGMAYWFLIGRGEAPSLVRRQRLYDESLAKKVLDVVGDKSIWNLTAEESAMLKKLYVESELGGDEAKYDEFIKLSRQSAKERLENAGGLRRKIAESSLELIEKQGLLPSVKSWYDKVRSDVEEGARVEPGMTSAEANRIIGDRGLQSEFERWVEELDSRYNVEERLFAGYTASGVRRMLPNTAENASKIMKSQGRNGATGWGTSFNNFAASLMKPMSTHAQMHKQSERLREGHGDTEAFDNKWSEVYFNLAMKCQPDAELISDDYGFYRLGEAALKKDPAGYLKREYGIELSTEDASLLDEMIKAIRDERPVKYFETKFERPVELNEFSTAVVPEGIDKELEDALVSAGLRIEKYSPEKAGDRKRAMAAATDDSSVRFHAEGDGDEGRLPHEVLRDGSKDEWKAFVKRELPTDPAKRNAEVKRIVDDLTEHMENPAETVVISSREQMEAELRAAGYDDDSAKAIVRYYDKVDIKGLCDYNSKKVIIFANELSTVGDSITTIWHEHIHDKISELDDRYRKYFIFLKALER